MPCWSRPSPASSAASRCSATASTWCPTTLIKDAIKARAKKGLDEKSFKEGDWVVATLKRHALVDGNFSAEITQLIATQEDHNVPWWVVLARHNLAQIEPADLPEWKVIEEEELPRRDLTQVPFFTIDGAKTKDMDDALAITKLENGWELLVAIADPTAYVAEGASWTRRPPSAPSPSTCRGATYP
jgi:exoribonuclease-2